MLTDFNAQSVVLLGDFNVHHKDWLGSHTTDSAGRRMLEVSNCLGLKQIVTEATRGDQILDLVLTDIASTAETMAALGTSDHNPVLVKLKVPLYRDKPYKSATTRPTSGALEDNYQLQIARKEYNRAEKQAKRRYNSKLKEEFSDGNLSSKKIVNTLSGRKGKSDIPVLKDQNFSYTTAREKAEKLAQTFAEKCQLKDADDPAPEVPKTTTRIKTNIVFKPKVIRKFLHRLKPDKATGPDEVPTRVLKEYCAELARPLSRLFSLCFNHGVFPSQWKCASVIPVHKRDSKSNPSMYRPISLLSNISKVMEAVVQTELQKYLLQNNLISDRQSKGVCGKLLTWIESYLSDRSIKVVLSGQSSTTTSINASVPQGSILGPLLFSVFIDDVGDGCESPSYLYADDSTLYCRVRTNDDSASAVMSLNRDL
ncbi:hypothetical protein Bbelb_110660 [Branchiostoma belcheri]|nr:hypothetical protein Bbelb_110660 [Branchiostoma belcheri]